MRGHICKHSKSSWTIVVDIGRDPVTGKRKQLYKAIKGTKKEAKSHLNEIIHQLDTGTFVKPKKTQIAGEQFYPNAK
jgi:hypothetical protein